MCMPGRHTDERVASPPSHCWRLANFQQRHGYLGAHAKMRGVAVQSTSSGSASLASIPPPRAPFRVLAAALLCRPIHPSSTITLPPPSSWLAGWVPGTEPCPLPRPLARAHGHCPLPTRPPLCRFRLAKRKRRKDAKIVQPKNDDRSPAALSRPSVRRWLRRARARARCPSPPWPRGLPPVTVTRRLPVADSPRFPRPSSLRPSTPPNSLRPISLPPSSSFPLSLPSSTFPTSLAPLPSRTFSSAPQHLPPYFLRRLFPVVHFDSVTSPPWTPPMNAC
jgi:hypothetical protein